MTLDQVSIAARKHGLNWSESRVADFESGRVAPNLATLIAVCLALADAGCANVTFPGLLRSESQIQINDSILLSNEQVANLLFGVPASSIEMELHEWVLAQQLHLHMPTTVTATNPAGATEERTWKALGISSAELADWSAALWKRTFSQERDRRAGEGANAQKRGQVSRQMRKELQTAIEIEAAKHGDDQ
jgi:hypothetical protein